MNKNIRILLAADSLHLVSGAAFAPIYAIYIEQIGGGILAASWAMSIFAAVTGICMYIFSRLEDKRLPQKEAVVVGYFIHALSYIGYVFVTSIHSLLIIQIIGAIALGIRMPAYDALYSR